jgi:hypothetical protein
MEHFFGVGLAFFKILRIRKQEKYFLNFSKIFGKIALSGVVGSERKKPLANVLLAKGGYSWKTGNETCKSLFG